LVLALGSVLSAHRRDELLQAARIAVAPERVDIELDLTPGIDVADGVIADIDRDGNRVLSEGEKQAYVNRVSSALALELDGRPLRVESSASTFPELEAFRRGEGTIRLHAHARLSSVSEGAHQLVFRNAQDRDRSVYLANALVPESDSIAITGQRRDGAQSEITIDFEMRAASSTTPRLWLLAIIACAAGFGGFLTRSTQRPDSGSRNAAISSPLRTSRTSPTSTGWFQVLPSMARARAISENLSGVALTSASSPSSDSTSSKS
jgi:hypothetical protein